MNSLEKLQMLTDNQCKVVLTLLHRGDLSNAEIARTLDMKRTSLNNILYPMRDNGIIVESTLGESQGGRRPTLYDIRKEDYLLIGIDISILYVKVVLTNIRMEMLYKEEFLMDETDTPEHTMDHIAEIIKKIKNRFDPDNSRLIGIGLGTAGPLNVKEDLLADSHRFQAAGWECVHPREMLEQRIHCPVVLENGVNCAVLLEALYGSGRVYDNIGYFNCGIGIRVGTSSAGRLIRSLNDQEEAFSQMQMIQYDGEKNKVHCIEEEITIAAMNMAYLRKIGRKADPEQAYSMQLFGELARAAETENPVAGQVISHAAQIMGIGISNFIRLMDSDLIIMAGPLIQSCPSYYEQCVQTVRENLPMKQTVFVKMGQYGSDSIALGAAAVVVENLLRNRYDLYSRG